MSRIGKLPISIPAGVTVTLKDDVVTVKGPKGELSQYVNPAINVAIEDGHVTLTENEKEMIDNPKQKHAFHGLYRSLVHNMVVGVSEGYKKELELVGVGYRASNQGNIIELALGYTHNIFIQLPAEVKVETKSERNKNPLIILESCDKQLLGQVCSKIRSFRKPEPYKGKGIKFVGEEIRRKSGKSAAARIIFKKLYLIRSATLTAPYCLQNQVQHPLHGPSCFSLTFPFHITLLCSGYTDICCCSVAKSRLTLCDPMDCSMPGSTVLHCLLEFVEINVR